MGEFRTNVAAIAGSCNCVLNWGFGDVVGEFRTNVAAVAGSCDCVFNWGLGDVVGEFRTNVAAVAGSCDVIGNWGFGRVVGQFRTNIAAVADNVICGIVFSSTLILSSIAVVLPYYVALCCGCGYRFSVMMIGLGGVLCMGAYFKKLTTR